MEGITTRPKVIRTYGSRPLEPAAGDNVQAESILDAPPYSPKAPKSLSPLASSPGSSPLRHSSAKPSYSFAWKAQLRDIDQGLEDENFSATFASKNACPSRPPVSSSGLASLISDSAPTSPMPVDHPKRASIRSAISSPAHADHDAASPTREQTPPLSAYPPNASVVASTSKSSNRKGAKAARACIAGVSASEKRPVPRKKKLSKKEEQEINKETARMLAGQHVSIKTDWRPKKRPMNGLFTRLSQESSDPIEAFSSPGERTLVPSSSATTVAAPLTESATSPIVMASSQAPLSRPPDGVTVRRKVQSKSFKLPAPADDDSDGPKILDPQTFVKTHVSQPLMINAVKAKKLEWLKSQAIGHPLTHILDDDIEIVPPPQGSAPEASTTGGRSSFLGDAVSRVKRRAHASRHSLVSIRKRPLSGKRLRPDRQEEMHANVLRSAEEQQAASRAAKEADWKRRGGTLKDTRALGGPHVSELMRQVGSTEDGDEVHDESDDEEDRDYCPDIAAQVPDGDDLNDAGGSAEPSNIEEDDDGNDAIPSFLSQSTASTAATAVSFLPSSKPVASDSTPPSSESSDADPAESQAALAPSRLGKFKRSSRRVIIDDEEVENTAPPPDSDAENARPAMDDSDLENMPPPIIQQVVTMETDDEDTGTPGKRKPLKRLTSFSSSSFSLDEIGSGPSKSRRAAVGASGSPRSAPLSELEGGTISDTDVEPDADFGLGGMSQLFGVNTQDEQKRAAGFHRPTHSFDFSTQPTLLPAVQISETKWKVNDEIFLQQQQDGVETRSMTLSPRAIDSFRRPLGNGQNSFFADFESQSWTQPAASRIERASSLASEGDIMPHGDATQSLMGSPGGAVRRPCRIQRGRRGSKSPSPKTTPLPGSQALAPTQHTRSSPEISRDAFKVLMSKSRNQPAIDRELVETYMEGEAEESDEEIAFGFGAGGPKDDDEVAHEEQTGEDGHIKDLVDDCHIDEETLAKDKVLEKVQEHTAEDDARALKIAQDAVEGNFRNGRRKRQRGLGEFDGDDSSDEDESRRPKVEKKRRIDGDKLHEFGKNPETAAFFKVYMRGINDDEEMANDGTFIPDGDEDPQSEETDMSEDESHVRMDKEREIVTAAQLRQEIREKAKPLQEIEVFDPMDINWYQEDDEHADTRVDDKFEIEVLQPTKPRGPPKTLGDEWGALAAHGSGPQDAFSTTESQLASFARGRLGNGGTVNGRGAAVTGYSKQEPNKMPAVESKAPGKRALKATPSALSTLTARTHHSFQ